VSSRLGSRCAQVMRALERPVLRLRIEQVLYGGAFMRRML
jgi:hypothetical protein